ncbi:MAG: Gfo/Idh/MocA family oxidoreductase [Bacillota bacterium]
MNKLRAGVVGLKMGMGHVRAIREIEQYDLVAVCDLDSSLVEKAKDGLPGLKGFTDFDQMLAEMNLDVLTIATPNKIHATMTIKAANAGVKGIACEKPIAMNLEEAYAMKAACDLNRAKLIVTHQRRMSAPYITMKRLLDEGAIGQVYLVRGNCAGDALSDGTHTIDSVNYLLGDPKPVSVLSQIHRDLESTSNDGMPGFRFGHPVESGATTVIYFECNVRFELFTGDMHAQNWNLDVPGDKYQDIEVFGTKGRLWRQGDSPQAELRIWDEAGGWRPIDADETEYSSPHDAVYRELYLHITENKPHTLSVENAIKDHEILMGIYESARLRKRLGFPINQQKFPLQVMIDDGEI